MKLIPRTAPQFLAGFTRSSTPASEQQVGGVRARLAPGARALGGAGPRVAELQLQLPLQLQLQLQLQLPPQAQLQRPRQLRVRLGLRLARLPRLALDLCSLRIWNYASRIISTNRFGAVWLRH